MMHPTDPFDIAKRELEARPNLSRKQKRYIKREVRAQQYAHQARLGGGAREHDRRSGETWQRNHSDATL
jgi:hypothetical protein